MIFSVIYQNKKEIRDTVIALLLSAISQGHELNKTKANHPLFNSKPNWPNSSELNEIPMSYQCEEFRFENGSLNTLRQLVIDVEVITQDARTENDIPVQDIPKDNIENPIS